MPAMQPTHLGKGLARSQSFIGDLRPCREQRIVIFVREIGVDVLANYEEEQENVIVPFNV